MQKTILVTGSTDGIGLATARLLASRGHHLLLHGRSPSKLKIAEQTVTAEPGSGPTDSYVADLSSLSEVKTLAETVAANHPKIDVLINNAGVFSTPEPVTESGFDVRFAVNTVAPYLLTQKLSPLLGPAGRVVNLSSAAQSPVDLEALAGQIRLSDGAAYAQSKLALTMWSRHLAQLKGKNGPVIVAVNPGSMLGSKMVKQAYGVTGADIGIGAEILRRAALGDDFEGASGQYFDNDSGRFASPHPDALNPAKAKAVVQAIEKIISG